MKLIQQDGKWFMAMSDYLSSEPKRITNYWLVNWAEGYLTEGDAYRTSMSGVYRDSRGISFNVESNSHHVETEDVAKPKRVRSEMRWHDGWQKMTHSGWQPC